MKFLLIIFFSCAQIAPKESLPEVEKETIPEIVKDQDKTIEIEQEEFENKMVDVILFGSGIKSIGISKFFNESEKRKIKLGKISGESFGLLISEVYKLKNSSNFMDWIFFKYFKDIELMNNMMINEKIVELANNELSSESALLVREQNGLLLMSKDFSVQDCKQAWYKTTNKIWCLLSGDKNQIYHLEELNMTVFELKAGLLNKDSLVDILELGKIFFRTHSKE